MGSRVHKHTVTHKPDSVSLGVVELLIEEDQRRGGHESCVGREGHTETASGGVKGLVHIATRDCLKQKIEQLAKWQYAILNELYFYYCTAKTVEVH